MTEKVNKGTSKCFAHFTDDELATKRLKVQNKNTKKADKSAEKQFRDYLNEVGCENTEFWLFDEKTLDKHLGKFWFAARQTDDKKVQEQENQENKEGEKPVDAKKYKVQSLKSLRYGLNQVLKEKGHEYDITKSDCFVQSQRLFEDACRELKAKGLGFVESYKEIAPDDLIKVYNSVYLDPDRGPRELQKKVMFDVRYYLCRHGIENFQDFKKDTFKLVFSRETGMSYVMKVKDELSKNHKETNSNITSGFMPQILQPDGIPHKMCPVRCYENYIGHLHPKLDSLWQTTNMKSYTDGLPYWYKAVPVGKNTISLFMSSLSTKCNLSDRYTNHCIHVTGMTNMGRAGFSPKQIMSVTGHKSIESLAVYTRVAENEKLMMGISLAYNLFNAKSVAEIAQRNYLLQQGKSLKQSERGKIFAITEKDTSNQQPTALVPKDNAPATNVIEPHAVDPKMMKIVPLDDALKPYSPQPKVRENTAAQSPQFDILDLMNEMDDNDLMLAATQIEQQNEKYHSMMTNTSLVKKSNVQSTIPSFQNCRIGTLNIHIHKN